MNTAILLLAMMPGTSERGLRISVGPRMQHRQFQMQREFARNVKVRGDNNLIILYYNPVDASFNYYYKQVRRPLFWRFRRNYQR